MTEAPYVSVLDLATYRLNGKTPRIGADFAAVDLAILGGCESCGAAIAAYNAYPSRSGFWRCADCLGDDGWQDVAACDSDLRADGPNADEPAEDAHLEAEYEDRTYLPDDD